MSEFQKSWGAEVLRAAPLIAPVRQFVYPQYVPGEEDAMERGALQMLVRPASGGSFLATCALGFRDASLPSGVFACPREDDLLAVAGGYAYLMDTLTPATCVHLPLRPVTAVRACVEAQRLVLAGLHTVAAVGPEGFLWETTRLSWEGVTLGDVREGWLEGMGWDMRTDKEVGFRVELATGVCEGGGFKAGDRG